MHTRPRRGTVYRLGDQVRVRVANANLDKKQLDFLLVDMRLRVPGEDDLGKTVTFKQALSNTAAKKAARAIPHKLEKPGRKKKEDKSQQAKEKKAKSSRGEKAVAAARAARAKKATRKGKEKESAKRPSTRRRPGRS